MSDIDIQRLTRTASTRSPFGFYHRATILMFWSRKSRAIALAVLLTSCNNPSVTTPTSGAVVGIYHGRHLGVDETLSVLEDHTFTQIGHRNGEIVFKQIGTWRIDGRKLLFNKLLVLVFPREVGLIPQVRDKEEIM